ncbi:MAG: hypothetical protein M3O99_12795 [Chloroflexota bacterium]|nr:hypothetical protein [Chloroflexota bacterium]
MAEPAPKRGKLAAVLATQRAALYPAVLLLGTIVLLALGAGYASLAGASSAVPLVQLLLAVASWPLVFLVVVLALGIRYGPEISGVLARVSKVWIPGVGLEAVQPAPAPPKPAEPGGEVEKEPSSSTDKRPDDTAERILHQQRARVFWYLHYLNLFLLPMTQAVLSWLDQAGRDVSHAEFESTWGATIPEANRAATIDALARHYLIEVNGPLMAITPWGRTFLAFRAGTFRPLRDYPGDDVPLAIALPH